MTNVCLFVFVLLQFLFYFLLCVIIIWLFDNWGKKTHIRKENGCSVFKIYYGREREKKKTEANNCEIEYLVTFSKLKVNKVRKCPDYKTITSSGIICA